MTHRPTPAELDRLVQAIHPLDRPDRDLPVGGYPDKHLTEDVDRAAVLVPILQGSEAAILLTVRNRGLTKHAGQVALPGGRRDPGENFPQQTALREASEEVGIPIDRVQTLGFLDRVNTISRFRITPVVGLVDADVDPSPCPDEVSHLFRLPLDWALDLDRYRQHEIIRAGRRFTVMSVAAGQWPIWGATATILHQLARAANA
ncbi:MAG: CoA pyrophosphatase, partial [Pseudomonadota bacterium]